MTDFYTIMEERGIITLKGPDAKAFLQGVITNDATKVSPSNTIYAALLTAQGRFLHDFFVSEHNGTLFIDCEKKRSDDLLERLEKLKLRSDVTIENHPKDYHVVTFYGQPDTISHFGLPNTLGTTKEFLDGFVYTDPRLLSMGARAVISWGDESFYRGGDLQVPGLSLTRGSLPQYDMMRIKLGIPDGHHDMPAEKAIILECGLDELNAIDWQKGCYMGQELIARTKHRGEIRKRLFPVKVEGPIYADGDRTITFNDEKAGEVLSFQCDVAMALLRLEHVEAAQAQNQPLKLGTLAKIIPQPQSWMQLKKAA